jgi:hypothetical protein
VRWVRPNAKTYGNRSESSRCAGRVGRGTFGGAPRDERRPA